MLILAYGGCQGNNVRGGLHVILQTATGMPLEHVPIVTTEQFNLPGNIEPGSFTNAQGHASVSLQPGRYVLTIAPRGFQAMTQEVFISPGQTTVITMTAKP